MDGSNSDVERRFPYSVVSDFAIPPVTNIPTPGHSESIDYNLIPLKIFFGAGKYTVTSCSVDKILGVFLLRRLGSLPYVVLFHSPVPVKVASNYPIFL